MSVTIQDNFNTAAAKPTDARYGPYNNVAAAKSAIPQTYRYKGLTVGIGTPVEEYWWANGTADVDLVAKTAAGNVESVTAGTGLQDIGTTTNPIIEVDNTYVQLVDNLSTDVSTDGTSDIKYPSVKAVKDYADGLVVGLLNDRGNWAASAVSPGPYPTVPPATGSGPAGAIMKGDIWFISTNGFLGTTAVSIGSSVRALVDSPASSTDWDIIDAGLGFTPENISNKVSTGANVNADPTSTSKYPSVRALVEYVQTYAPAPTVPTLQAVTSSGSVTIDPISVQFLFIKDQDGGPTDYWGLGGGTELTIYNNSGTDVFKIPNTGGVLLQNGSSGNYVTLDVSGISSTQTYTFPNATGTIALTSDITSTLSSYVPYTGATSNINLGEYGFFGLDGLTNTYSFLPAGLSFSDVGFSSSVSIDKASILCTLPTSQSALMTVSTGTPQVGAYSSGGYGILTLDSGGEGLLVFNNGLTVTSIKCNNVVTTNRILQLPDSSGTFLTTVATSAGNLSTGTDGKVTIPNAGLSTTGLVSTGTQTFGGTKTFNDTTSFSSNVGIGTSSPWASAKLQIDSTTQGFLPPRMTTAQMNAIVSPKIGLMIFNTDTGYMTVYRGPSFSPEWWRLQYVCEDC